MIEIPIEILPMYFYAVRRDRCIERRVIQDLPFIMPGAEMLCGEGTGGG
jgi:hypothetical protein